MNRIFCVPLRRSALVWNSAKHINYCNLSSESFLRLNPLLLITTTTATTTTRTTRTTRTTTTTTAKARQTIYQKSFRSTKGTQNFILSFSFSLSFSLWLFRGDEMKSSNKNMDQSISSNYSIWLPLFVCQNESKQRWRRRRWRRRQWQCAWQ